MFKSVKIKEKPETGIIRISSRPELFAFVLFLASLMGICFLPSTAYRDDYFAYGGLLFLLGLTLYYFIISIQQVTFENKTRVKIRKGWKSWIIPFSAIQGGYTTYRKKTSRQSLQSTHFLNLILKVDLPDDPSHWIRNGKANIFHYGFNQWGVKQEEIWNKLNRILEEKGIPVLTSKRN